MFPHIVDNGNRGLLISMCFIFLYATYMMTEESWRAFVAMTEAYERYGLTYFDRMEKMFPNLKPINDVWKNVMGIIEEKTTTTTTGSTDGSNRKQRQQQNIDQMKIERLLILEHKMHDTPAPMPPDRDCVPFRVQDGKLFVCKNENGKLVTHSVSTATPVWQAVAERIKAEDAFRSFLMTLNDNEFEAYVKLRRQQQH